MESLYRVYVIQNKLGRRYIGLSQNVRIRLKQHNNGESRWTSKYRPWEIVWTSNTQSLREARKLENRLKRAKGGNTFYELTGLRRTQNEGTGS